MIERIKIKCKEQGKTVAQLEKECNLGNGTIRRWDKNLPSVDKALQVANLLNTSIEWLITGKDPIGLTEEEQYIIDCYRSTDERGKVQIKTIASMQPKELTESSTIKIG